MICVNVHACTNYVEIMLTYKHKIVHALLIIDMQYNLTDIKGDSVLYTGRPLHCLEEKGPH